jgi:hypothetical protein
MTCPRCDDTGLIEYTGGSHTLYGNTLTTPRIVEATPEKPIYKPCDCRYEKREPISEPRSFA